MWDNSFAPIRKHRLGTGDIANHIEIVRIEHSEVFDEYKIYVTWAGSGDTLYEYVVEDKQYPFYETEVSRLDTAQKLVLKRIVAGLTT